MTTTKSLEERAQDLAFSRRSWWRLVTWSRPSKKALAQARREVTKSIVIGGDN